MIDDEIVGMADIAHRLDVQYQTVSAWRMRGLLPPPDGTINQGRTPWWWWSNVAVWARETGRL